MLRGLSKNTEQGVVSASKARGVSVPFPFVSCLPEWLVSINAKAMGLAGVLGLVVSPREHAYWVPGMASEQRG